MLRLLGDRTDRMAQFTGLDWDKALAWLKARTGTKLAPEQQQAVQVALTSKVAVLTGGPGCGKSFTVRSIVELAAAKKAKILLVAPTGRAAKRLAELDRPERGDGAPAAETATRWGTHLRPGDGPWTLICWWSTRRPCWT